MIRRSSWLGACLLALLAFAMTAGATVASASLTVEATFEEVENEWAKVERIYDNNAGFLATDWPGSDTRMDQTGQRKTFFNNVARPASGRFLLYYGKNWNTNTKATPVLLVPGAFSTADTAWANPASSPLGCGVPAGECPSKGMMQGLAEANYKTFAISFNNGASNNYNWAESIHDAIQRVKAVTGAEKVDLVSWSKGTVASRMYVSGMKESWGSAYGGDVRKLIQIAALGNGYDNNFRTGRETSQFIFPECSGGAFQPLGGAAHTILYCGGFYNAVHLELSIYKIEEGAEKGKDPFVGIRQITEKQNLTTHPLDTSLLDYYSTYYGGWGYLFGSYSLGIDFALKQTPGSVIPALRSTYTVPSSISTYLLCGDISGTDKTVFTDSCASETGIGKVTAVKKLEKSHLQIVWDSASVNQVKTWLE